MAEEKKPIYHGMNLYQRLHAVMGEVSYVQKEDKKVNNQYSFVSHDAVTAKVRAPLVKWGVIYHPVNMATNQNGNRTEISLCVRFVNIDNPAEVLDVPSLGYGIDQTDKGVGKAISYAVKYALLKTFGLETGDDPERDNIEHTPETKLLKTAMTPEWPADHPCTKEEATKLYNDACDVLDMASSLDDLEGFKKGIGQQVRKLCSTYQINAVSKRFKERMAELGNREMDRGVA